MPVKLICEELIITCIDFRIQQYISDWIKENTKEGEYDRVALAGGVFDFYSIMRQVEISNTLHNIKKVILINHEDCGAYGQLGTFEKHVHDLQEAERKIEALFNNLDVETYFLKLNGEFIDVSKTNRKNN